MRGATLSLPARRRTMAQPSRQFTHVEGPDDEVVEEVLAEGELVELVVVEEQDDRTDAATAGPKLPTEVHGLGEGERGRVDDRPGEAVGRFERGDLIKSSADGHRGRHSRDVERFSHWPFARGHAENDVVVHSNGR